MRVKWKFTIILVLLLNVSLMSAYDQGRGLYSIFYLTAIEFKCLVNSNKSRVKLLPDEVDSILAIRDSSKALYISVVEKLKKSVVYDQHGKVVQKADRNLINRRKEIEDDVYYQVYELIGPEKYKQLSRTLFDEYDRKTLEALKKLGK